jgi:hypothetical protein
MGRFKMKAYKYRFLLWQFIAAADSGEYDTLSVEEVSRHAAAGTIPAFLVDRFGSDLDLSIFEPQDWIVLSEAWESIDNAIDARRKFGVEKRGICLLMAYALQSLQTMERETERV